MCVRTRGYNFKTATHETFRLNMPYFHVCLCVLAPLSCCLSAPSSSSSTTPVAKPRKTKREREGGGRAKSKGESKGDAASDDELELMKDLARQQQIDMLLQRIDKASAALANSKNDRMTKFWGDQLDRAMNELNVLQGQVVFLLV